ncbi:HD-GYP domain-containing protein [Paenibacillus thermotolerans]|uniref:HD-GYP domain-containing protein n=1 Tax=Paenibacillus thermotolerans TaxID=3027807 RepID=UPI002368998F|nr:MULTISPECIES: HD-GYP domain-containing protein [unclassified Paenibacillus]
MLLMPLQMCRPGMKISKPIFSEEGMILLGERMELTDSIIRRLERFGINYIYIEDSRTEDIVAEDVVTAETRTRAVTEIRNNFRKMMDDANKKRPVGNVQLGKTFKGVLDMIIDDISGNKDAMIMLLNLNASDQYLYHHSVNVCIYATVLGQAYGYSRDELTTLGLGALLHDIGKTKISPGLLSKPGKLTDAEYEEVKKHAEYGFKMLKDEPNVPLLSAHIAFQHHERLNGSGYPRGISGSNIHEYARWVGLVDSYDAMTSPRSYRPPMLPHEAMEIIYTCTDTLYEKSKIELFRDKIAIYPLGILVQLNTGESGVVVDVNSAFPQRPVVRVLSDADNQTLTQPYEVDLSKKLSVNVANVITRSPNLSA